MEIPIEQVRNLVLNTYVKRIGVFTSFLIMLGVGTYLQTLAQSCPVPEGISPSKVGDVDPKSTDTTKFSDSQTDLSSAANFASWWMKRALRCDGYAEYEGDPLAWLDEDAKKNFKRLFQSPDAANLGTAVVFAPIDLTPKIAPDGTVRISISGDLFDQTGVPSRRANHIEFYVRKSAEAYRISRFELPSRDESNNAGLFHQAQRNIERIPAVKHAFEQYMSGYRAAQKGEYLKAEEYYSKAIGLRPKMALAYRGRAASRVEQGNYAGATEDGEQACIIMSGETPIAYFDRGRACEALSDWRGAEILYTQSISYDPYFIQAFLHRARARQALGNLLGAQEDISKASRLEPCWVSAHKACPAN